MLAAVDLVTRTTPDGAYRYLLPITLGGIDCANSSLAHCEAQSLDLMIDTGSSYLMVRDMARGACSTADPPVYGDCYNSSASATNVGPTGGASFSLAIDGLQIVGSFSAATDIMEVAGTSRAVRVSVAEVGAVSNNGIGPPALVPYFWADAAGVLGLSPQPRASYPWEVYVAGFGSRFSLDLQPPGRRSRLGLGAPNRSWAVGAPQWSSQQHSPAFHRLELVDLAVCGAALIGDRSSYWPALVDTGASCLGLPERLFDALFAWVAVANCTGPSSPTHRCILPPGVPAASLPTLSFRLRQNAPQLQLPLEDLVLPARADGARELCILRLPKPTDAARPWPQPWPQPIILGTQALLPFVTHFEMGEGRRRVGLAAKHAYAPAAARAAQRRASCAAKARCTGQQRYQASDNRCMQPSCKAFFMELDADEGVCRYATSFRVVIALIIGIFGLVEIVLHEAHHRLPLLSAQTGRDRWWRLVAQWATPTPRRPPPSADTALRDGEERWGAAR